MSWMADLTYSDRFVSLRCRWPFEKSDGLCWRWLYRYYGMQGSKLILL